MKKVAIITDDPGWHGKELHLAFEAKDYFCINVSLTQCSMNIGSTDVNSQLRNSIRMPGFEDELPDGVFVRGVPGGTLEEVVFYLDILHALQELNILVYNNARAVERSVDKGMTSFLLHQAGIATPPTWVGNDVHQAYSFVRKELAGGHKVVVKPLFGSQGKNLQLITKAEDITNFKIYNNIYYLQRFIDSGSVESHDWRLFVIAGQVVSSMRRQGEDWIANVATGAKCFPAVLDEQFIQLAQNSVSKIGMHYGGVDLMRDKQGGLWVTEVNSIPAWKGLQSVSQNKVIADLLVEDFIRCLNQHCLDVSQAS
ncbi:MAG: ATP-grasp domain-containing protein [Pseudomonadota bacterium]